MKYEHINNPDKIDPSQINKRIDDKYRVIVQFSEEGYSAELLREWNVVSNGFNSNFEIRFYGQYFSVFDASNLKLIPVIFYGILYDCNRFQRFGLSTPG